MSHARRKSGGVVNVKSSPKSALRARHSTKSAKPKPSNASIEAKRSTACKPTLLDEETSVRVIAEFLAIGDVETREIDSILHSTRAMSPRQIALTFRISEVLGMPDAFEIAPRFRAAFEFMRSRLRAVQSVDDAKSDSDAGRQEPARRG